MSVTLPLNVLVEHVSVINGIQKLRSCHNTEIKMKQTSRRAKGKKLQRILREKLLSAFPHLHPADIRVAKTGENGEDLKLSRIAKRLIPFQFECKNQEKFKTLYSFNLLSSETKFPFLRLNKSGTKVSIFFGDTVSNVSPTDTCSCFPAISIIANLLIINSYSNTGSESIKL